MQVSVLTDQVEAQGEKIRDLDMCLDEHREKLNATEEMLQQVCVCVCKIRYVCTQYRPPPTSESYAWFTCVEGTCNWNVWLHVCQQTSAVFDECIFTSVLLLCPAHKCLVWQGILVVLVVSYWGNAGWFPRLSLAWSTEPSHFLEIIIIPSLDNDTHHGFLYALNVLL